MVLQLIQLMQKGLIRLNTIKIYLKCIFAVAFFSLKSFFFFVEKHFKNEYLFFQRDEVE